MASKPCPPVEEKEQLIQETQEEDAMTLRSSTTATTSRATITFQSIVTTTLLPVLLLIVYANRSYFFNGIIPDLNSSDKVCNYYMAESTIPNGGWGMFTYRSLYTNDIVNITNGELGIPLSDVSTNTGVSYIKNIYYNYLWSSDVIASTNEGGGHIMYNTNFSQLSTSSSSSSRYRYTVLHGNVLSVISGIGMLCNGHPLDFNIVPYHVPIPRHPPSSHEEEQQLQGAHSTFRTSSATAGSMTYYHHLQFFAYHPNRIATQRNRAKKQREMMIPAGGELFINYGTGWSTRFDFNKNRLHLPTKLKQNVHPNLLQDGYCIDNIASSYPTASSSSSTKTNIGYGGLASRHILNNSIIVPIPVIPIHRNGLLMQSEMSSSSSETVAGSTPTNQRRPKYQLLLNYCFGHVHSNILLLPYGPGIQYINHHITNYNAILRWSTSSDSDIDLDIKEKHRRRRRRPGWIVDPQNVTIEQVHEQYQQSNVAQIPKLLMELVAIRDIQYGEEILIQYGKEWEKAYQDHETLWLQQQQQQQEQEQSSANSKYVYAYDMNQNKDYLKMLPTEEEQRIGQQQPYPYNLQLQCFFIPQLLHQQQDENVYTWNPSAHQRTMKDNTKFHPNQLRPCRILHRIKVDVRNENDGDIDDDDEYMYHVEMIYNHIVQSDDTDSNAFDDTDRVTQIQNLPRYMISFRDVPYTQDQYNNHVFRHEIQLSDDIFPNHWKDITV